MEIMTLIGIIGGILGIIGALIVAVVFVFGKSREVSQGALRQSNEDLRKLVDDQGLVIGDLKRKFEETQKVYELRQTETEKEVSNLKGKLTVLTEQNGSYQQLIMTALEHYFSSNPDMAASLMHPKK